MPLDNECLAHVSNDGMQKHKREAEMRMFHAGYFKYWGKASDGGNEYHPLVFHGLDVAACGQCLLAVHPGWVKNISSVSNIPEVPLISWLIFLLAIHDIGKFSDGFQNQIPQLFEKLQSRRTNATYNEGHDVMGYEFCRRKLHIWLPQSKDGENEDDFWDLLAPWLAAVTGHHGRPPKVTRSILLEDHFPLQVEKNIQEFIKKTASLLLPDGTPFSNITYDTAYEVFPKISWLVAGLAVVSDWLGSNQAWFSCRSEAGVSLEEYWKKYALPGAERAIQESGMKAPHPARFSSIGGLFPVVMNPTALQDLAQTGEIAGEQQLFIIEEVTGGGKTEAAIVLAQRLMERGLGDGLFIALPTMATANAIHDRIEEVYRKLFTTENSPSLVLAHSMARIRMDLEDKNISDHGYPKETSASQDCTAWLSDNRKKALLADVGVGTIDQALLAILPVRHQSLRLLGLCRKVLIVDEVHACDAYVLRLLCVLLKFHASWGGSAILLSATLPQRMRECLLEAYAEGAGWEDRVPQKNDYPLITHLTSQWLQETTFAASERQTRRVHVAWLKEKDHVWKALQETMGNGGCACWVRNTVVDHGVISGGGETIWK